MVLSRDGLHITLFRILLLKDMYHNFNKWEGIAWGQKGNIINVTSPEINV